VRLYYGGLPARRLDPLPGVSAASRTARTAPASRASSAFPCSIAPTTNATSESLTACCAMASAGGCVVRRRQRVVGRSAPHADVRRALSRVAGRADVPAPGRRRLCRPRPRDRAARRNVPGVLSRSCDGYTACSTVVQRRGGSYRLGMASSPDGIEWTRARRGVRPRPERCGLGQRRCRIPLRRGARRAHPSVLQRPLDGPGRGSGAPSSWSDRRAWDTLTGDPTTRQAPSLVSAGVRGGCRRLRRGLALLPPDEARGAGHPSGSRRSRCTARAKRRRCRRRPRAALASARP